MTSDLINKITAKSKQALFEASRSYKGHARSSMPYEQEIVVVDKYPDFIFLVQKNMIFERNSISDSSYDVFSFDKNGNYVRKEDVADLGWDFFKDMKVIKRL